MPAILTIDLSLVAQNYHYLRRLAPHAEIAPVLKANAYGMGLGPIAIRLFKEGCRKFFVAQLSEALSLQEILAQSSKESRTNCQIFVLNGFSRQQDCQLFAENNLLPVLNSYEMVQDWYQYCQLKNHNYPAILHIDTAMHRLGLSERELLQLSDKSWLAKLNLSYIMSHLTSSEDKKAASNQKQLRLFKQLTAQLPPAPYSLANSGGILLGADYHFSLLRPGLALYGIYPDNETDLTAPPDRPLKPVMSLEAPILQMQNIKKNQAIGYNGSFIAGKDMTIATIELGYGDGWPRALSNKGCAYFKEQKLPIIGKISMDLLMLDISPCAAQLQRGAKISFIGGKQSVSSLAAQLGTVSHEILTSFAPRLLRKYIT